MEVKVTIRLPLFRLVVLAVAVRLQVSGLAPLLAWALRVRATLVVMALLVTPTRAAVVARGPLVLPDLDLSVAPVALGLPCSARFMPGVALGLDLAPPCQLAVLVVAATRGSQGPQIAAAAVVDLTRVVPLLSAALGALES